MPPDLAVIVAGAFLSAFAVGIAGFADALVASAIWLHVLGPVEAVPLIVSTGLVIHSGSLAYLRRSVRLDRLWPFLLGGALGVPLGVWMLGHADPDAFRVAVGVFLVAYTLFSLLRPFVGAASGAGRRADGLVGLVGGVLGGLAGLSGVAPTIWSGLRGWPKEDQRGIYQPFILAMHGLSLGWLAAAGMVGEQLFRNVLWCLPALALGTWLGHRLFRRLDDEQFRRIVLAMLLVSGVVLLF